MQTDKQTATDSRTVASDFISQREAKYDEMYNATSKAYLKGQSLIADIVAIKYGAPDDARAKLDHALNSIYHAQMMVNSARNIIAANS